MSWPKLAISALLGLYFGCTIAYAEPGILAANSQQVPEAIRQAAGKVLRLWTPLRYESVPAADYDSILSKLNRVKIDSLREEVIYHMMRAEVQRCKERRQPTCRVPNKMERGSAFVLEDGSLIAARHVFLIDDKALAAKFAGLAEDWARDIKIPAERARVEQDIATFKRNPLHDLLFVLTDANGRVVFNSAHQGFRILRFGLNTQPRGFVNLAAGTVQIEGHDPKLSTNIFAGMDWVLSDGVRIQIAADFPPLKLAAPQTCASGRMAIAGYAGITTSARQKHGARDAVENELSVAQGNFLTPAEAAQRWTNWDLFETYKNDVFQGRMLLSSSDATEGMSGGPILNSRGEVCGMLRAMFPGSEDIIYNSQTGLFHLVTYGIPLENLTGI